MNNEFLEEYESLNDAGKWIVKQGLSSFNNVYSECLKIKKSIEFKEPFLNYIWISEAYESKEKKNNISKLSKQELQLLVRNNNFKEICYLYSINKNTLIKYCKKNLIPYLENDIKNLNDLEWDKECNLSEIEYTKKYLKKETLQDLLSKDDLIYLLKEKSFTEIGKIYKVSDNSIRKLCKKYCIPFRKEDIKKISNENWETECNLSKEEYTKKYLK